MFFTVFHSVFHYFHDFIAFGIVFSRSKDDTQSPLLTKKTSKLTLDGIYIYTTAVYTDTRERALFMRMNECSRITKKRKYQILRNTGHTRGSATNAKKKKNCHFGTGVLLLRKHVHTTKMLKNFPSLLKKKLSRVLQQQ